MKKFTFIVGLFFLVFGFMAFQNAIDNLVFLIKSVIEIQEGGFPAVSEQDLGLAIRRGGALLQVTRAILVFGFVILIYSIVDEMKKIKTRFFN